MVVLLKTCRHETATVALAARAARDKVAGAVRVDLVVIVFTIVIIQVQEMEATAVMELVLQTVVQAATVVQLIKLFARHMGRAHRQLLHTITKQLTAARVAQAEAKAWAQVVLAGQLVTVMMMKARLV